MNDAKAHWPDVGTRRGMQDKINAQVAYIFLKDDPKFDWLTKPKRRESILAELGRMENEALLRRVAIRVCECKPKTKEAVAVIRNLRGKQKPKPDGHADALAGVICVSIRDYKRKYRCTFDEIQSALDKAIFTFCFVEGMQSSPSSGKEEHERAEKTSA